MDAAAASRATVAHDVVAAGGRQLRRAARAGSPRARDRRDHHHTQGRRRRRRASARAGRARGRQLCGRDLLLPQRAALSRSARLLDDGRPGRADHRRDSARPHGAGDVADASGRKAQHRDRQHVRVAALLRSGARAGGGSRAAAVRKRRGAVDDHCRNRILSKRHRSEVHRSPVPRCLGRGQDVHHHDDTCRSPPRIRQPRADEHDAQRRSDRAIHDLVRRGVEVAAARRQRDDARDGVGERRAVGAHRAAEGRRTDDGFVFFTNYDSAKGARPRRQPARVACCSSGPSSSDRCGSTAPVTKTSAAESESYFQSRPFESQHRRRTSPQSRPVADRIELERRYATARSEVPGLDGAAAAALGRLSREARSHRILAGPQEPPARSTALHAAGRRLVVAIAD